MSLKRSATRHRLGLLTGSSIVAASLSAFCGLALAPMAAMAQATCTSPAAPTGNGTTAVTIAAGAYEPGITCSFTGATSTVTTAGAVTVSANAGGDGINLSATGTGAVNWVSTAGAVTGGAQTNGPVIDATSVSGPINISVNGVTATTVGITHGIRATSTGGGNITTVGSANNNNTSGQAAIEAVTNGGNISVTTASGFTTGRMRGIHAQTNGSGTVSITTGGQVSANAADGVAAIDVIAGTGATTININNATVSGGAGKAIVVTSAGAVTVNNTAGTIGTQSSGVPTLGGSVDFSAVTGSGVTVNNSGTTASTGRWMASGSSVFSAGNDTLNMSGIGQNVMLSGASINLGAGNDTFNMAALFSMGTSGSSLATLGLGSGTDTLNLSGRLAATSAVLDFGADADTFTLSGVLAVNGLTIDNLETLNLSGVIFLGAGSTGGQNAVVDWTKTDGATDDVLRMTGGVFTGFDDARVVMDINLDGGAQPGCATLTGVADCLDLRGGSTSGETVLTLNNVGATASQSGYDTVGITLVDVGGGGTSGAGHFVLDPDIENFQTDAVLGGVINRPGLFVYTLRYDPATQRHSLVGLPRGGVLNYAMLGGAAQSIWHMTSETVTDRQTELRSGAEGAMWMRASGEYTDRQVSTALATGGDPLTVDNSYKLYAGTIMGGMDLVTGTSGGYDYVLGGQVGYVGSAFELDASPSTGRFTGATGGVYASVWNDRAFLNGTLNGDFLTLNYEAPSLASRTNTYVYSFGARLEGGVRAMLTERTFVEPLATLAFVRTSFEEISLAGGEVHPGDVESRRGAMGLRLGADLTEGMVNVGYFVAGRAWKEFEGESRGVIANPGADLHFADALTGAFGEAEAGVNLVNDAGTLSGFLAAGVKFKEGYDATNLSFGLRMRW